MLTLESQASEEGMGRVRGRANGHIAVPGSSGQTAVEADGKVRGQPAAKDTLVVLMIERLVKTEGRTARHGGEDGERGWSEIHGDMSRSNSRSNGASVHARCVLLDAHLCKSQQVSLRG